MYNFSNNFRLVIVEETSDIIDGFVVFKCPSTPRLIVNKPTKFWFSFQFYVLLKIWLGSGTKHTRIASGEDHV